MRKRISLILKFGLSLAMVVAIALQTDIAAVGAGLSSVTVVAIATVLALIITQTIVTAYRWLLIMRSVGTKLAFWPTLRALFASLFLNQCLPSYVGGDAYRIYWLYQRNARLGPAIRGVMIDRISAFAALIVMMTISFPLFVARFQEPAVRGGIAVVLVTGIVGFVVLFVCDSIPQRWRSIRIFFELAKLSETARQVFLKGSRAFLVGLLAVSVHMITALIMYVFAWDLEIPLTPIDCFIVIPPVVLLSAIPISIAGWGVREGVMVGALAMLNIGTTSALVLSVLLGFTMLANGLVGILPFALSAEHSLVRSRQRAPLVDDSVAP